MKLPYKQLWSIDCLCAVAASHLSVLLQGYRVVQEELAAGSLEDAIVAKMAAQECS